MNEQELDSELATMIKEIKQDDILVGQTVVDTIKSLCFQARDKWVLEQIEDLDAYDGIYDQGEDEYCRHRSKNMGDAVLIDDIRKVLGDK